jgi:ABC-type glycerol-3-phosphate transport system substrate-binding protein
MSLGEESYYTFATGWVWALTSQTGENQELAVELAEYLTEDEFLAAWLEETGYLPTRALTVEGEVDETINAVIEASHPLPSEDTLNALGPLMQQALVRVLNGEQPQAVARSAVEELR